MEHHVYFWLKEEHQNAADRAVFEQGLAALFEIDLVEGGCWGVPAKVEQRPVTDLSWSYAVSMRFASVAEHDTYQVHPDHEVFVKTFIDWWAKVLVIDMEARG